jgi:hypothetical protein
MGGDPSGKRKPRAKPELRAIQAGKVRLLMLQYKNIAPQ